MANQATSGTFNFQPLFPNRFIHKRAKTKRARPPVWAQIGSTVGSSTEASYLNGTIQYLYAMS